MAEDCCAVTVKEKKQPSLGYLSIWCTSKCRIDYVVKHFKNKKFPSETHQSIIVLIDYGFSMLEVSKKLEISSKGVHHVRHRTVHAGFNQDTKRSER